MTDLDRRAKRLDTSSDLETRLHTPHSSKNLPRSLWLERTAIVHGSAEKFAQSSEVAIKHLDFLDTSRGLHGQDGGYLVRVGFDALLSDQIGQEFFRGHSKGVLFRIEPDHIFLEVVECLAQVLHVIGALKTLHEHIVDIHVHDMSD